MKLLFVHAHFDDFEFTAAGTFELWRRADPTVRRRVLVCTDGAAGHHALPREAVARRRLAEQAAAAALGGFEFDLLRDLRGHPFREGRLHASAEFRPALWRAIRDFEPDYLFCPPLPDDGLAGVHVDHLDVAEAVRGLGYLLNVPHAYSPEFPIPSLPARPVRTPVILTVFDGYHPGGSGQDFAVEISEIADHVADLAWCHESQLREWLPWVNRHQLTDSPDVLDWRRQFRSVLRRRATAMGIIHDGVFEFFRVTAWGAVPTMEQVRRDFPPLSPCLPVEALERRLNAWNRVAGA